MKTAIPFAVAVRKIEPSSESATTITTAKASSAPARTALSGHQPPIRPVDHRLDREEHGDVQRADSGCGQEAREQERAAADRAHDERLEQPALGIAAHDAERQEDRQHGAEEERREHREPEDGCAGDHGRVEPELVRRDESGRVPERPPDADPVQGEEGRRQEQHDQEDLAPHALPQGVAGDYGDVGQAFFTLSSRRRWGLTPKTRRIAGTVDNRLSRLPPDRRPRGW